MARSGRFERFRAGGPTAALLLGLGGAMLCGQGALRKAGGNTMSIEFRATPRAESWIAGSRAVVDLRIDNRGSAPVEVPNPMYATSPQPVFHLTRPSGGEMIFTPAQNGEEDAKPTLIELPPGVAWEGELVLSDYADLSEPGAYRLSGELDWRGVRATIAPVAFQILAARFTDVSASVARSPDGSVAAECAVLQSGPEAVTALIEERDPRTGELDPPHLIARGPLPSGTRRIHGVWANYDIELDPHRWIVSSTEKTIDVGHNLGRDRTSLTAPKPMLSVLTPLAIKGPALYLLAVLDIAPAAELGFGTLSKPGSWPATAALKTVLRFDARPAGAAATLAGTAILVAVTQPGDTGTRVRLALLSHDGAVEARGDRFLQGLVAESALAVHFSSRQEIRVGFVAHSLKEADRRHLVETVFDRNLAPAGAPGVTDLALKGPASQEQISYVEHAGGTISRVALFRQKGGGVFVVDPRSQFRPARARIPEGVPVALLPGRTRWYAVWPTSSGLKASAL